MKIYIVLVGSNRVYSTLLERYQVAFANCPGKIKPYEAKLLVGQAAKPVFCKTRTVLIYKGATEETLE